MKTESYRSANFSLFITNLTGKPCIYHDYDNTNNAVLYGNELDEFEKKN